MLCGESSASKPSNEAVVVVIVVVVVVVVIHVTSRICYVQTLDNNRCTLMEWSAMCSLATPRRISATILKNGLKTKQKQNKIGSNEITKRPRAYTCMRAWC